MSLDGAKAHRPAKAADREAFAALGDADVVVSSAPKDMAKLAAAFSEALSGKPAAFRVKPPAALLTMGPELDGPDKVKPLRLVRKGHGVTLEIVHTRVREQGVQLRRNIRWRPMVEVPLDLPSGSYTLQVTWRGVESLTEAKPLKGSPVTRTVRFEVR